MVGANPLKEGPLAAKNAFVVVQDMFLTETAQRADVLLPAASAYEKNGTVTNVCGEVQRLKRAISTIGAKPDLEIIGLIAKEMGFAAQLGSVASRHGLQGNTRRRQRLRYSARADRGRCANKPCRSMDASKSPAARTLFGPRTIISSRPEPWDAILKY